MKDTPSLLGDNRFACLEVEEIEQVDSVEAVFQRPEKSGKSKYPKIPRWEKKLARELTIAATPTSRSLLGRLCTLSNARSYVIM